MPADTADTTRRKLFDRLFALERHEYVPVAWSFVYFFCVLSAYYMVRPVRETMAVESGVQSVPWLFSSTFVVMLAAVPIFGWVASRYPRKQFLPWVYIFFATNILLFYAGFSYAVHNDLSFVWLGRAFFVWVSIFNLFVVSVFWSFMVDIYSREQGRRLFGLISAGGSVGALIGPVATSLLVVPIGFQNLLPISAALLLFSVYCITRLRTWVAAEHQHDIAKTAAGATPLGGSPLGGIKQVTASGYLSWIAIISLIATLLGAALYMLMTQLVADAFATADERTQVFGFIDGASNALSMLCQLLLVNRSVRHFGVGVTLAFLPIVSLIGFALLSLNPVFVVVAVLQAARRGIGFGFGKPATDMLYSVVTPKEKYKAKNFIETAVHRGGDLIGSWAVKLMWSIGVSSIALLMLPFAAIWVGISLWLGREYRRRDRQGA